MLPLPVFQVVINNEEYHLHKFPLYIKSDFFRALATSNLGEKDRVELADFPGGGEIFKTVANFCYNMKVSVCKFYCSLIVISYRKSLQPAMSSIGDGICPPTHRQE